MQMPPSAPQRIRLPRPVWILATAIVLIIIAVATQFGFPIWNQRRAIAEIEALGGSVQVAPGGPEWLREYVGKERMQISTW